MSCNGGPNVSRAALDQTGRIALAKIWPKDDSQAWPDDLTDEASNPLVGFTFYDETKADVRPQPRAGPLR